MLFQKRFQLPQQHLYILRGGSRLGGPRSLSEAAEISLDGCRRARSVLEFLLLGRRSWFETFVSIAICVRYYWSGKLFWEFFWRPFWVN